MIIDELNSKQSKMTTTYGGILIAVGLIYIAINILIVLPFFLSLIPKESTYYALLVAWTQLIFIGIEICMPLIPILYGIHLILNKH